MDDDAGALLQWSDEQYRFSATAMLRAVSATELIKERPLLGQRIRPARGSILAAPEIASYDPNPDYFFHWLRDSAIVVDALRVLVEEKTLGPDAFVYLIDFVEFSLKLCRLDGPSFLSRGDFRKEIDPSFLKHVRSESEFVRIIGDRALGDVRFNADATFDLIKWSRPQNDGPALRALSVMRFLRLEAFRARAGEAAATLLRYDLDYTLAHWREPCYDLWEEVSGFHYYTRLVQYAALADGADWTMSTGDAARAQNYRAAAQELLCALDRHFDACDGVYLSRLPDMRDPLGDPPARRLDIATPLAVVHAGRSDGRHSVADPIALATLIRIEQLFAKDYRINRERAPDLAPALGRYAGDIYFSGGAWYLATLGAAQFYFMFAEAIGAGREIPLTTDNRALLGDLLGKAETPLPEQLEENLKEALFKAALARGDSFMAMVQKYTPASRELSEQFDQTNGAQTSAKNLAWSYASFITAYASRKRAVRAARKRA